MFQGNSAYATVVFTTIVFTLLIPFFSAAQAIDELELEQVVVTAKRANDQLHNQALAVEVIERADIVAAPADNLAELLEYIGGVDVRQRALHGVQADVSIRGGSYEQTLILLNGISLSNAQTGHHNMDIPVNLNDIERIEIIKGSAARVYGANAMAGVINVITRKSTTPALAAQLKVGEYDYTAAALQTDFISASWNNHLALAQQYSSGFAEDEPTGCNLKTASYTGNGKIGANELELGISYSDKDFGASRFYFNDPYQTEHTKSTLSYLAADLHSGRLNWRPQLAWLQHQDSYTSAYGTNDSDSDKYTIQVTGELTTFYGQSNFALSTEREYLDSSNMGNHARHSYNLLLNHQIPVTAALSCGAGLSAVYYSDWGWEPLPGADISYNLTEQLRWFASVGRSVRIPTYTEMFYTIGNIGNPDLKAEQAWSWESGLRWHSKRTSANLSIFRRDSDDLIDWSRIPGSTTWQVRNVAKCTTSGIEVGFDIRQPFTALPLIGRTTLSYTYLNHDADSGGMEYKYILDSLRHQLQGAVYLDWQQQLSHVIKVRVEERMAGETSVIVDTKLTYAINNQCELSIEGNNLFDEQYVESGDTPMPGRWIMAGINLQHDFI